MRLDKITVKGLPPFTDLLLDLKEPVRISDQRLGEVHLLTGPNGTGKSRILACLAAMAGNPKPLEIRLGVTQSSNWDVSAFQHGKVVSAIRPGLNIAGTGLVRLTAFAYSGASYLIDTKVAAVTSAEVPSVSERLAFVRPSSYSAKLSQALLNLKQEAAQDFMNRGGEMLPIEKLPRAERIITLLESRISKALCQISGVPAGRFAFRSATRPHPSLQVDWNGKTLQFNQLPDGLRMVIGWLVDVVVMTDLLRPESSDPLAEPMLILLDEPETHLHPAWQRKIIPLAQELLPNAQMLIATHSPFIVMSVNEGWIHRLEPQADGSVKAMEPEPAKPGDSYASVLRDIMGVSERFDPESEKVMEDFRAAKERALDGKPGAEHDARVLLGQLALRGEELGWIARAELEQLEEELKEPVPA